MRKYEHRPTSQGYKTPDAILMIGQIYEQREKQMEAQYYYREVINRFPSSAAALEAEKTSAIAALEAEKCLQ